MHWTSQLKGGLKIGWIIRSKGLSSAVWSPTGKWLAIMSLRDEYWCKYFLIYLLTSWMMGTVKVWVWYQAGVEKGCYVSMIWKKIRKIKEQQESNGWMRNQMLRWASGETSELHKDSRFKNWEKKKKKSSGTDNCSLYLNSNLIVHSTFIFAFLTFSMFDSVTLKDSFFVRSDTHRLCFYCMY